VSIIHNIKRDVQTYATHLFLVCGRTLGVGLLLGYIVEIINSYQLEFDEGGPNELFQR
jgi:hypothetical protein